MDNHKQRTPIGEIPSDWEVVTTKEIFKNKTLKNYPNEPVLSVTQEYGVIYRDTIDRRISMDKSNTKNFKLVEQGNFIISLRSFQGGIESSSIQGLVSPAYTVLKVEGEDIEENFYRYYFKYPRFISYMGSAVIGIRDGKQISYKVFSELFIPKPPYNEQQKIASILSSVDEAIEKTEQIIEQTTKVKKGLMQQLLTKGIGHTKFQKTSIGEIPEEWRIEELQNITDVRDGTHDSPKYMDDGIPLITSKNLKPNGIDFSNVNYISTQDHAQIEKRSGVEEGDILFGMIGTIGNPVVVKKEFDFSIKNVALVKFDREKQVISNYFIYYLLQSSLVLSQLSKGTNGGVQKFIALGTIRKLMIPTPSKEEQEEIVKILFSVDEKINVEKYRFQKLEILKKSLMQQLLTGKVRVPIEEDEVMQT
ncbi:restriction endonuclease subunit S [Halobacillus seohaensis]|uniref:Restriction endonuclease subunit S n=1 Tax=Halobacillus seohaensis TaxID=447421 RepID=A0ABW2EFC9_9BACI